MIQQCWNTFTNYYNYYSASIFTILYGAHSAAFCCTNVYNLYIPHIFMTSCPPGNPFTWHSFRSSLLRCSVAMANNLRLLVDSRRALAETSWAETSVLFFLFLLFHGSLNLSNVFNMWRTPQKKERWESNTSKHCGANCIAIYNISEYLRLKSSKFKPMDTP